MKKYSKPKTFLENGFPVTRLHNLALSEGNSKRPIYQIHKWWARRLGSVFRTLLISSFSDPNESEHKIWSKYYNGFSLENKVVYDPMMGGGTSVIEALRLGCNVIGSDINPVAWFVTKKEIDKFDEEVTDSYFNQLEKKVGKKIKNLYTTTCNKGHNCEILYSIWIRQLKCNNCKKVNDLYNEYVIYDRNNIKAIICPKCNRVFTTKQKKDKVSCNRCKSNFNIYPKIVEHGFFNCKYCGKKEKIVDAIKRERKLLDEKMIAIQFECDKCGREFKTPNKKDRDLFSKASRLFKKNKNKLLFPRQKISHSHFADNRPITHGFLYYSDLFNSRQLYSLSILLNEIKKIPNQNAREFLLLTLSSSLETNNALCKYETKWGKISALFGIPSYHIPYRYGENNLWGNGRGSFVRAYRKLRRGKKYASQSYELIENKLAQRDKKKKFLGESSITEVNRGQSNFLLPNQRAYLYCRDSRNMGNVIKTKSVDIVITDPPYFDTINYSGLADFFYVWLRLVLKESYPYFKSPTSKKQNEIVLREFSGRGTDSFVSRLSAVLKDCKRVLKDDGLLVFTFHHTQEWAWIELRKALLDSGFRISNTHVIRSEGRTGFNKNGKTSYDVCVIARKSKILKNFNPSSTKFAEYLKTAKILKKLDNNIQPADIFTIIMSKYIQSNDTTAKKIMEMESELSERIQRRIKV